MKQSSFRSALAARTLPLFFVAMAVSTPLMAQANPQMPAPTSQPAYGSNRNDAAAAGQFAAPAKTPAVQTAVPTTVYQAMPQYAPINMSEIPASAGSTYIPVDSWIYPALLRLYSMGYLDTAEIGMRPWTRLSVLRMLRATQERIHMENNAEALSIYNSVLQEISPDLLTAGGWTPHGMVESTYERVTGIGGTPLNDSYHLGQTLINDYGRPYEQGFNDYTGFSARGNAGRFTLYVRGEYQHAPSATGYSPALTLTLANNDGVPDVPQSTIPAGPIAAQNYFRLIEANLSYQFLNHEFSFGKSDVWDGPALGGAFDWSNNAQNNYSFRINRVEPLHIPWLSYFIGPVRYEFLVSSLKGHTYPNDPWVHMEKFEFQPSGSFEFGFSRTVIWGGKGHEPVTMGTFWNSFWSFQNVPVAQKFSTNDPGARFSTFDYTVRLPFLKHWLTQYTDSEVHDDVTPVSAPRRAAMRTGIYLSHVPGTPKLDLRAEAVYTDVPITNSQGGGFMYVETVQRQGYTNEGNIFGDWIGR